MDAAFESVLCSVLWEKKNVRVYSWHFIQHSYLQRLNVYYIFCKGSNNAVKLNISGLLHTYTIALANGVVNNNIT